MIRVKTRLIIKDNSGIQIAKCIKILGTSNKKYAKLGNLIICTVVKKNVKKIKMKKNIFLVFITQTKKYNKRRGNVYIKGNSNNAIILNEEKRFNSTRTYGRVPVEFLRNKISNFWQYINGVY